MKTRKTVALSGWYGLGNAGDDAILYQWIKEICNEYINLTILSENPDGLQTLHNENKNIEVQYHHKIFSFSGLRSLIHGSLFQYIKRLSKFDLFVLGGGGILRDNTTFKNLLRILDEIWLAKIFGAKAAVYAVGAGPFVSRLGKFLIKKTIDKCDLVTVRDLESKNQLIRIGCPSSKISVVADPALLLKPQKIPKERLKLEELFKNIPPEKLIGFFPTLNFLYFDKDISAISQIAAALDNIHRKCGFYFVAIPMQINSQYNDVKAAELIAKKMGYPNALRIYREKLSAPQIKWLCGQFKFNITIRLHAAIFSISMGVPAIAINYEQKVHNFMQSCRLENYIIEMDTNLKDRLIDKVIECEKNFDDYKKKLDIELPKQKEKAKLTFKLFRELIDDL